MSLSGLFLASGGIFSGYSGGGASDFLLFLEQNGVFTFVLPFLLLFALIFGILMRAQIFKDNRGLNAIIAISVALLALQFDFVPIFFSEIFPRVGVALSIILALMILAGLFMDPDNKIVGWGLLIIGLITFVVVLLQTAGRFAFSGFWWNINWPLVVGAAVVIGIIIAVINSGKTPTDIPKNQPIIFQPPIGRK
ncbi:MAG TPA: hypothetical protein ENI22_00275 [Candidatus Pacearchaeota archaeon]|nr:hypothetical protein [Candidatus Pacearchaeota archaeon]